MKLKPDLRIFFAAMPLIGIWIEHDYENANTENELTEVMHKWFKEAESTSNEVKKRCYESSARYIYAFLTGRSYESKLKEVA